MGADIHSFAEVRKEGKWRRSKEPIFGTDRYRTDEPFDQRSYGMFGFFADVRNYSNVPPISPCKGLPTDSEGLNEKTAYHETLRESAEDINYHSHSWLTLKELTDFDYDATFEDLRYEETIGNVTNGAAIAEPGKGNVVTFREFLGEWFFKEIELLKTLGEPENVRIVFWFDN